MALGVIGHRKGMKIHQGAITHEICSLAAQFRTTVQQNKNKWSQLNVYSHLGTNMTVCEYECVCQICEP